MEKVVTGTEEQQTVARCSNSVLELKLIILNYTVCLRTTNS
jgi:hypothetical protein